MQRLNLVELHNSQSLSSEGKGVEVSMLATGNLLLRRHKEQYVRLTGPTLVFPVYLAQKCSPHVYTGIGGVENKIPIVSRLRVGGL